MKRLLLITILVFGFKIFMYSQEHVTVVWGNVYLTYNGNPQAPTATATNSAGHDVPLTIIGEQTYANNYMVSSYTVYASTSDPDYILDNYSETFYISPLELPVQWGNTSLTYNGSLQLPTATATGIFGENLSLDVTLRSGYNGKDAGVQMVVANFNPYQNNYWVTEAPFPYTIAPATVAVQWSNTLLTYNGYPQAPTASATGVLGENLPLDVWGEQTNVGSYSAAATFSTAAPNYVLGNATTAFAIGLPPNPLIFHVQWDNTPLIYNGYPQSPYAFATNYQGTYLQIAITGAETDAGSGYIAEARANDPNFIDPTLLNKTATFDISPAAIDVQWGNTTLTYNGNPQAPTATATGVLGEDLLLTVTGERTDVGTGYTATASLRNPNGNYELRNTTVTFEIVPATIAVQWSNTSLTYNGNPQAPTATATGIFGEGLPLTVTGEQTDAGTGYTATASFNAAYNYILINPATLFNIAPASIAVEWSDVLFTYNGNPQAPTATATGIFGEDLPVSVTGEQTNAGTGYTATASFTAVYSNYLLDGLTALFDIAPATLAITAISMTVDQGLAPALAYAVTSGRLFGSDALNGALSVVETLHATSLQPPYPAGIHLIVQGTLSAGSNYRIIFTEGVLTVLSTNTELFGILVNDKSAERKGDFFYFAIENGVDREALVNVISDGAVAINGLNQNPCTVALPNYGYNYFIITITAQNGNTQDHTLVIDRYYEKTVYEYPDVPAINCNPQTNGGYVFTGFQWYRNGVAIVDATDPFYQVKDNATYYCELTLIDGAKMRTIDIFLLSLHSSGDLTAYPNPTQGKVTVQRNVNGGFPQNEPTGKAKIQVFDINGALVLQPETNPFDMSALPQGMYFIRVNGETVKVIKKN